MKRILFSITLIAAVALGTVGLSSAFFSDAETSVGNVLAAGAIDLRVDNESYYNGVFWPETSWDSRQCRTWMRTHCFLISWT